MNLRMNTVKCAIGASILVAFTGCSDLMSHHYDADHDDPPPGSFPYALVRTKIVITYTLQLSKCGIDDTTLVDEDTKKLPSLGVKVSAATAQIFEADPTQKYYISTKPLTGTFKNTSIKLTTGPDQSLQGLNAEYSDQSLQVAGAGLQAAASIAGSVATAGVPVPALAAVAAPAIAPAIAERHIARPAAKKAAPAQPAAPTVISACTPDANKSLGNYTSDLNKLQSDVKSAKVANPASDAVVAYETTTVGNEQSAITATISRTIIPQTVDLISMRGKDKNIPMHVYQMNLTKYIRALWVDSKYNGQSIGISFNGRNVTQDSGDESKSDGQIDLYVYPSTVATHSQSAKASTESTPLSADDSKNTATATTQLPASGTDTGDYGKIDGVVIRQPAAGYVRVCEGSCDEPDSQGIVVTPPKGPIFDIAPKTAVTIPQFGKTYRVTLHAHIGDDVNIGFSLGPDGSATSLTLVNNSTAAQGLTAVNNAATAYTAAITAQNGAVTAANSAVTAQAGLETTNANLATSAANLAATNAQLNDTKLKAQADCLQQQKTILTLGATPITTCSQ